MSDIGFLRTYYSALDYNDNRAVSATSFPVKCQDQPGLLRWVIDATTGLKAYRFVSMTGTCAAKDLVYFADNYGMAATMTIPAADATGANRVLGVARGAITTGNYGWIQVYGNATVTMTGAHAIGDIVVAHTANNDATVIAAGANITQRPMGICLSASGGAADATVFLSMV